MNNIRNKISLLYIVSMLSILVLTFVDFSNISKVLVLLVLMLIVTISYAFNIINLKKVMFEIDELKNKMNDKSETKLNEDEILDEIIFVTSNLSKGELGDRIKLHSENKKYQEISNNINSTLDNFQNTIKAILVFLDKYQKNDFTYSLKDNQLGDFKLLVDGINSLNIKISKMLLSSLKSGIRLRTNSDSLKLNINQLTDNLSKEAATLEQTTSAVEEITSIVINNNLSVNEMTNYSNDLTDSVKKVYISAQNSANLMDIINTKTKSIEEAIVIIDQIAFQTNILSLNAAVEAATAGEAGRGFAIVAQEVRNLASRSTEAAKEIKNLVKSATDEANKGKNASSEMIKEYNNLNEKINKTKSLIENVSESLKEQQKGIEQINISILEIDSATQENAFKAKNTMQIAEENDKMANTMVVETNKTNFLGRDEYNSNL